MEDYFTVFHINSELVGHKVSKHMLGHGGNSAKACKSSHTSLATNPHTPDMIPLVGKVLPCKGLSPWTWTQIAETAKARASSGISEPACRGPITQAAVVALAKLDQTILRRMRDDSIDEVPLSLGMF